MINKKYFLSRADFDFSGKTILLRIDCDVDLIEDGGRLIVDEDFRLRQAMPTIEFLKGKGVGKIILLGHLGRPDGVYREEMRLEPIGKSLSNLMQSNLKFEILNFKSIFNNSILNFKNIYQIDSKIYLLENVRFDTGEEENDENFTKELAGLGDVYINEAFGVSHRDHASITGIPKFIPGFLGLNFENEVRVLGDLREKAERPLIFILGGSKKDKLEYLQFLGEWCDKVLVGGKLPSEIANKRFSTRPDIQQDLLEKYCSSEVENNRLIFAELNSSGKDLNEEDIRLFKEIIKTAKTIVWAGPMGVYEEEENRYGTIETAKSIIDSPAELKIAGGGDTHRILSWLGIWNKFNFVSCGGGAMLSFFKNGTLVGIKAINNP